MQLKEKFSGKPTLPNPFQRKVHFTPNTKIPLFKGIFQVVINVLWIKCQRDLLIIIIVLAGFDKNFLVHSVDYNIIYPEFMFLTQASITNSAKHGNVGNPSLYRIPANVSTIFIFSRNKAIYRNHIAGPHGS